MIDRLTVGIRIFCSQQRNQGQNRETALKLLRSRLYELEVEKRNSEIAAKRRSQVSRTVPPRMARLV